MKKKVNTYHDSEYDNWIEDCAGECKCCPVCNQGPCEGVFAGGLCEEDCHCETDNYFEEIDD